MMLNYFLFMAFVVIGLFFGALAACAVMGGHWVLACLFAAAGILSGYTGCRIPLSEEERERQRGGEA